MKVFVTGATGLVGAHTALALLQAGHQVRLLVRNRVVAENWFRERGYTLDDFVVSDMLDKAVVKAGMQGCDAVVHAAAIVDLNAKNAERTQQTNLKGIDTVIGSACELGIEKILYVSSLSVFFDPARPRLDETCPLADVQDAYSKSKRLCEERVRALQAEGKPIIITYPSGIFGPDDPKLSESNSALLDFVKSMVPITSSGMQFVDARDVGTAQVLLLEKPLDDNRCNERYMITGHFLYWRAFAELLEAAAGKRLNKIPIPGPVFRLIGKLFDFMRNFFPIAFPISRESMTIVTQSPSTDSSKLLNQTGMHYRPPLQTLQDTIGYFRQRGELKK